MMTPEQRYFFDVAGYLHLKNVINGEALEAAQEAADRYINASPEELPSGFDSSGKHLPNGFAYSRALEALTLHPATWSIIKELTDNKPQLFRGTMIADRDGMTESEDYVCIAHEKIMDGTETVLRTETVKSIVMISSFFLT